MNRGNAMQAPDHDHIMFLTRWSTEIIMGLVTVLLVVVRFIGKHTKTENVPYATREEMRQCQKQLMDEFKDMRKDLTGKIDHSHDQMNIDISAAHKRIDDLYKR
jgi:hypothetical protein